MAVVAGAAISEDPFFASNSLAEVISELRDAKL